MGIPQETKDYAWSELLELEKHVRYYDALASQYKKKKDLLSALTFYLSATAPPVAIIAGFPDWSFLAIGLIVSGFLAWIFASSYGEKSIMMQMTSHSCARLLVTQRSLFDLVNRDGIEPEKATVKLNELARLTNEITSESLRFHASIDSKLNERCWKEVNEVYGKS